jgi:anti-anti-sigma regulatory factor
MFETGFDKTKDLLRVAFAGHVDREEAKQCTEQMALLLPDTKPGFRLLTDLTSLETMDTACAPFIRKSMDLCNEHGVRTVIRVIPDPHKDIGFNILSLFHYRQEIHIVTCETMAEATKVLENERGA